MLKLEKRLQKAERKKHQEEINRIIKLQDQLFPNQTLQERKMNFSEISLHITTEDLIQKLLLNFEIFSNSFNILTL